MNIKGFRRMLFGEKMPKDNGKIRLSEGLVSSFYFIALLTPVHCFAYFSA